MTFNRNTHRACKHYLDQGIFAIVTGFVAVAAFEGLQHCGNGERQKKQPDENGDVRRFLESF